MPTSEEVKAYFDRVAPTWDTMRQDYYGVAVIDKAVAAAGLNHSRPICWSTWAAGRDF